MTHSEFERGKIFWTGAGRWLCTDKGTRVVTAIYVDGTTDSSWLKGPPYAVAEHVFDEYDMQGCYETPDEVPSL